MPKYIMLCRISAELAKTGNWQNFRQYQNTMARRGLEPAGRGLVPAAGRGLELVERATELAERDSDPVGASQPARRPFEPPG